MVDLTVLPAFVAMILVFLAPPGPDMAYVVAAGLRGGPRAAVRGILGIGAGMGVYAVLVAVGLGQVIDRWPLLLDVAKLGGAAYLLWLARVTWRDAGRRRGAERSEGRGGHFVRGFLVSIANPKLILFFMAVLPQFVGRATDRAAQLAMLGAVNVATEVILYGSIGVLAGSVGLRAGRTGGVIPVVERVAAVVYVVLAVVVTWQTLASWT